VDLNHGPRPYQGRALTELSYGPNLGIGKCIAVVLAQREVRSRGRLSRRNRSSRGPLRRVCLVEIGGTSTVASKGGLNA
jgi:hypothetical protein